MADKEAPKQIWLNDMMSWSAKKMYDDDVKYIRADRYIALLDAAVSLHYHLFKLTDTLLNRPDVGEREIADMLDDAQPALDKWNRFLDGKEE